MSIEDRLPAPVDRFYGLAADVGQKVVGYVGQTKAIENTEIAEWDMGAFERDEDRIIAELPSSIDDESEN